MTDGGIKPKRNGDDSSSLLDVYEKTHDVDPTAVVVSIDPKLHPTLLAVERLPVRCT